MTKAKWEMPEWMEEYRECFTNTGGNTVEELMNNNSDMFSNAPLAALSIACIAQVGMLTQLKAREFIK